MRSRLPNEYAVMLFQFTHHNMLFICTNKHEKAMNSGNMRKRVN